MTVAALRTAARSGRSGARRFSGLALLAMLGGCGPQPGLGIEALTGATVIDVVTGREIPRAVILIRNGHVLAVGNAEEVPVPNGAAITDLRGRWVIPGLIDAHTHLQPWGMALALRYGVTAVRDLHSGLALADTLRAVGGRAPSPRLFLAMAMLDAPPTTYTDAIPVSGPDSADAAVALLSAHGAAWIKVYSRVTPPILEAIINAARPRHLPVAAHLGLTDAVTAARLGVESIEHLSGIPEATADSVDLFAEHAKGFFAGWTAFEESWSRCDTLALAVIARELAAHRVTLVPTLVLHETFSRLDDSATYRSRDLAAVPDSARRNWNVAGMIRRAGWTTANFRAFRAARPQQDFLVRTFVASGGQLVAGTDASNQLLVPGASLHTELELLVRAGLTALDALRSGTFWAAELLRADSLGRLRPGTVADLVVLDADPLANIRNTRRISRVMLGGNWLAR